MAIEGGVIISFYDESVQDERKSKEKGYPVFNTVTMIDKRVPNQVDHQPRPMREEDKRDFPVSWQAYVTGKEPAESGLPVNKWPQLNMDEVSLLNACNVKTVEQLAELADSGLHRLGPSGQTLKKRAKKFLEEALESSALRDRIQELERKIEGLTAVKEVAKPAKRQPKKLKVSSA
jgi:hypothetical protein